MRYLCWLLLTANVIQVVLCGDTENSNPLKEVLDDVGEDVKNGFEKLGSHIEGELEDAGDRIVEELETAAKDVGSDIENGFDKMGRNIKHEMEKTFKDEPDDGKLESQPRNKEDSSHKELELTRGETVAVVTVCILVGLVFITIGMSCLTFIKKLVCRKRK